MVFPPNIYCKQLNNLSNGKQLCISETDSDNSTKAKEDTCRKIGESANTKL